jgi:hypothetical protein
MFWKCHVLNSGAASQIWARGTIKKHPYPQINDCSINKPVMLPDHLLIFSRVP